MLTCRILAEVMIKGHHTMNFGLRQVQILRDDRKGGLRHIAKLVLNGMQDRKQRTLHPLVGVQDIPDAGGDFDGIKHIGGPFGSYAPDTPFDREINIDIPSFDRIRLSAQARGQPRRLFDQRLQDRGLRIAPGGDQADQMLGLGVDDGNGDQPLTGEHLGQLHRHHRSPEA